SETMADTTLLIEDQHHRTAKYIFPVLSAWVSSFATGTVLGYSSPALPSLDDLGSHLHLEGFLRSFFVSLMALGAVIGCVCAGFFNESFGRKGTLIFTSLPFITGWALMACSGYLDSLWSLMIGRFLTGYCCGLVSLTAPMYIAETADPEKRGFYGSGYQLSCTFGIVMTYVLGKYLNWADLALLMTAPPFLCLLSILCVPESPAWLLRKGRIAEATEANLFLHGAEGSRRLAVDMSGPTMLSGPPEGAGGGGNSVTEGGGRGGDEMADDGEGGLGTQLRLLVRHSQYYRPLLISISLMFFQQFCGVNCIITSMNSIFQRTKFETVSPPDAAIITGFIQVAATLVACFLCDRCGRKMLTIISGLGTGLSLIPLTIFDYLSSVKNSDQFNQSYGWIPILSVTLFIIFFSLGLGPVPWLILGEMLPFRVKNIASIIAAAFNWLCAFIILTIFLNYINLYYIYLIFSAICLLCGLFGAVAMPETKGKSLTEIEAIFSARPPSSSSDD
ncbi:Solute carrier 2 (Facilitated glucose transporter) member 8, partial [Tyrophagus putrescentiae]